MEKRGSNACQVHKGEELTKGRFPETDKKKVLRMMMWEMATEKNAQQVKKKNRGKQKREK